MLEILDWTYAYRKLMVVDTACELDVFTRLEERAHSAEELAQRTGAGPLPLKAMLDVCVGLGLMRFEQGLYANRPVAQVHLVRGRPLFLGDVFRLFAAEASQWLSLKELVMTGRSAGHGPVDISERRFTMAMHALGMLGEAAALEEAVDLSDRRDLIDVGCGSGLYSVHWCRRNPELKATLLDRPKVLEVATSQLFILLRSPRGACTLRPQGRELCPGDRGGVCRSTWRRSGGGRREDSPTGSVQGADTGTEEVVETVVPLPVARSQGRFGSSDGWASLPWSLG